MMQRARWIIREDTHHFPCHCFLCQCPSHTHTCMCTCTHTNAHGHTGTQRQSQDIKTWTGSQRDSMQIDQGRPHGSKYGHTYFNSVFLMGITAIWEITIILIIYTFSSTSGPGGSNRLGQALPMPPRPKVSLSGYGCPAPAPVQLWGPAGEAGLYNTFVIGAGKWRHLTRLQLRLSPVALSANCIAIPIKPLEWGQWKRALVL